MEDYWLLDSNYQSEDTHTIAKEQHHLNVKTSLKSKESFLRPGWRLEGLIFHLPIEIQSQALPQKPLLSSSFGPTCLQVKN